MENWQTFMLESNKIEGENRLNPNDKEAFSFAFVGIDTLDEILELHKILGRHLKANWIGRWRSCNVQVGEYKPPKHQELPVLLTKYVKTLPIFDSYEAHNQFELIHPFRDLNGRVGRLIWLSKAIHEGYDFSIPFLHKYYYQTLNNLHKE
jgi:Fic family protein